MKLTWSAVLMAVALAVPVACSSPSAPSPEPGSFVVLQASARIAEGYPAQVTIEVEGYMPSVCSELLPIRQRREGNRVQVGIHARSTSEVCVLAVPPRMRLTVPLQGGFTSGEYVVTINDYELRFRI